MGRRTLWIVALGIALAAAAGAAWEAPQMPTRVVQFFDAGQRFFLETFADGYQAVRLDGPTEEALRLARNDPNFDSHVYTVIRRGEDFVHFRTASEETDVIVPIASIKRISYRVEREFQ